MVKKTTKKAKTAEKKTKTTKKTLKLKKIEAKKKIINFVSGNKNKLRELSDIFKKHIKDVELKLALEKAKNLKGPVLVEDTSLCFNAYGGLPGAYIKYFLKAIKPEGLYKMACAFKDHSAYAQSIYGLQKNVKTEPKLFIGKTDGEIVSPRGDNNFGWDPCFQPKNYKQTYAEMEEDKKNKISHRGKSTKAMIDWIKDNLDIF